MKTLIIMRHGHAEGWARTDFDRKLTPEGLEEVNMAALHLRSENLIPGLILCSAAMRASQTAVRMAAVLGVPDAAIVSERALYHIDDYELLRQIQHMDDGISVMLMVGHNPTVSSLASGLNGEMRSMRPAGMAMICDSAKSWKTFGNDIISSRYF